MNYELKFNRDNDRRQIYLPPDAPLEWVEIIAGHIVALRNDPFEVSMKPPLPYRQFGRMSQVKLMRGTSPHYVSFFFHVEDEDKAIVVRRVTVAPSFRPQK